MKILSKIPYFFLILFFVACSKDDGAPITQTPSIEDPVEGVLVINEGAFNANNASVSFLHSNGNVSLNMFEAVNDRLLGDVLQSVAEGPEEYFLVVNNSGKIERVNKYGMKSTGTILGFVSPRYMHILNSGKALVTNLIFTTDESTIDVVNLTTGNISDQIAVNGACEELMRIGNKIFVANPNMNRIIVIDANTLTVTGTISTPAGPNQLTLDKNNKLWVLASSYFPAEAHLCRIDPTTETVELTLPFTDQNAFPNRLVSNGTRDFIYFLAGGNQPGVYRVTIASPSISSTPFISSADQGMVLAYGLGVDPETGNIYVGDAVDFTSAGKVFIFNSNGTHVRTVGAGVAPSGFDFR